MPASNLGWRLAGTWSSWAQKAEQEGVLYEQCQLDPSAPKKWSKRCTKLKLFIVWNEGSGQIEFCLGKSKLLLSAITKVRITP